MGNCIDPISFPTHRGQAPLTWGTWLRAGFDLLGREISTIVFCLEEMAVKAAERRTLMTLDERSLGDLGLTRCDALARWDND